LGLSLVKSLIELHGGNVVIASASGPGTRITCRLPVAEGATAISDTGGTAEEALAEFVPAAYRPGVRRSLASKRGKREEKPEADQEIRPNARTSPSLPRLARWL